MKKSSQITLQGLELNVSLGWSSKERKTEQPVTLDVRIDFLEPPVACLTDELKDTHCYAVLIEQIKSSIATKNFRLIEHLGHEIYQTIKNFLSPETKVTISITKKPLITHLNGGVVFCYGDGA